MIYLGFLALAKMQKLLTWWATVNRHFFYVALITTAVNWGLRGTQVIQENQ